MASAQEQAALHYISSFATLDMPALTSIHGKDFHHEFLPASLSTSPRTSAQWAQHIQGLSDILAGFPVEAEEVFHDVGRDVVAVRATSRVEWRKEVMKGGEGWEYEGTYVFFFYFEGNGERNGEEPKVKRIVEFVDSKGTERFRELVNRARTNLEQMKK